MIVLIATWSKYNFCELTELMVVCYTKFAKMLFWSALQVTFLASSERVNKLLILWKGPYIMESHVGASDYRVKIGVPRQRCTTWIWWEYIVRESEVDMLPTSLKDGATLAVARMVHQDTEPEFGEVPDLRGLLPERISLRQVRWRPSWRPVMYTEGLNPEVPWCVYTVDSVLKIGVMRPSTSPDACPIIMVSKKDASKWVCVDFRNLNKITEVIRARDDPWRPVPTT